MQHDVCALDEIPDLGRKIVDVGSTSLLLLRAGDRVYAVAPSCPHMGLPLRMGSWDGAELKCRFHGARFDPATGVCNKRAWLLGSLIGREDLPTWPVTVENGRVLVEV
jgi:nitrite reductase/ring-hydroxylating ferredoxin subunit